MVEERILSNGLHMYSVELPHLHVAEFALFLRCGALYETRSAQGVSHFLEHLHYRRMGRVDHEELNRIQARVGSELEGATYPEGMVYRFSCLPEDADLVSTTMAELLRDARWTPEEIRRERQVVLRQIESEEDDFDNRCEIYSRRTDRGAWPLMGGKSMIERMSVSTLMTWRRKIFQPANAALCIAGPVPREAREHAAALWAQIPATGEALPEAAIFPGIGQRSAQDDRVWTGDGELCRVQLMFDMQCGTMAEQMLLSAMTGGSVDSRLFLRIREQLGLVAEIESYIEELGDRKLFCIRFDAGMQHLEEALRETSEILIGIRQHIREEDLLSGRQQLRMNQAGMPDVPGAVNNVMGWGWIMHEQDVSEGLRLREQAEHVRSADLQRLADGLLRARNLRICMECPADRRRQVRRLALEMRNRLE